MSGCTGNCNQGRNCTCLQNRSLFLDVMEGFVTLAFVIGLVASLCLVFGYVWYRT